MKAVSVIGFLGIVFFLVLVSIGLYTYLYYTPYTSSKEKLLNYKDTGIILLDRNNTPFYFANNASSNTYISLKNISPYMEKALISAEDKSFYQHHGISFRGIVRSVALNLKTKSFGYGGSTLTQQLVKNTLLSSKKSFLRKIQEAFLAFDLETRYTKRQILEMYMNSIYFGEGARGIAQAANTYFGKKAQDLTLAESAYLASIIKYPSAYSAFTGDRNLGIQQGKELLKKMYETGTVSENEYREAKKANLSFVREKSPEYTEAPHYSLLVLDKLKDMYGDNVIYEGMEVVTSLDLSIQRYAQETVAQNIEKNRRNGVSNGSAVVIDPTNGDVVALVGSYNWYDEKNGKLNMAISPRQPGSSFKPIVYSLAFENGDISTNTTLKDEPKTFILDSNCASKNKKECVYKPHNYDGKFRGSVSVRRALANSLNIPAVEVMQRVGINELIRSAPEFGITTLKDAQYYGKGLSLVLGSAEVSPLQMASAYSAFANNGRRAEPIFIREVKDKYGKVIFSAKPKMHKVLSFDTAFFINSILSDNRARSETFGSLLTTPFPSAVKTGTTENYRDAWTIGYTPNLVVAVWVGNNDASLISNLPGSLAAAPIWKSIMLYALKDREILAFTKPENIVQGVYCDPTSSSSAQFEYYIEGTQRKRNCNSRNSSPANVAKSDEALPHIGGGEKTDPLPAQITPVISPEAEEKKD